MPPLRPGTAIAAAQRGILMHKLLERLPELPVAEREQAATAWLMRNAPALDGAERVALIAPVMAVLETPDWAELFGPQALAEVPIAALVGDQVIAGTIDRLLVEPGLIRLVDFKTARRPPARVEDIPVAQLRQMAAYVAALRVTYPGRRIEAALLYTETPALFPLSDAVLAQYAPGLSL